MRYLLPGLMVLGLAACFERPDKKGTAPPREGDSPLFLQPLLAAQTKTAAPRQLKPINLADVNTAEDEDDPHVSQDGLRLYYTTSVEKRRTLMLSKRARQ